MRFLLDCVEEERENEREIDRRSTELQSIRV